jgi:DNA-binding winged helix-turn-helix (wHTH) protein
VPAAIYQFERFILDDVQGMLLTAEGVEIPLRAKSFELLRLFLENAGRLLSREEIMRTMWRGIVVTDDSLTQCVGDLRRALKDDEAHLLRTVKKRGYMFAAEVKRTGPVKRHSGGTVVPEPAPIARSVIWQESKAGRALQGWAVAKVLTLGRHDDSPGWPRRGDR